MEPVFAALVVLAIAVAIGSVRLCCPLRPPPKENPTVIDILVGTQSKAYAALQEILMELRKLRELHEHQVKQTHLDETLMHYYAPKQEEDPVVSDEEAREFDSVQRTLTRARKGQWGSQRTE